METNKINYLKPIAFDHFENNVKIKINFKCTCYQLV